MSLIDHEADCAWGALSAALTRYREAKGGGE